MIRASLTTGLVKVFKYLNRIGISLGSGLLNSRVTQTSLLLAGQPTLTASFPSPTSRSIQVVAGVRVEPLTGVREAENPKGVLDGLDGKKVWKEVLEAETPGETLTKVLTGVRLTLAGTKVIPGVRVAVKVVKTVWNGV